MSKSHLVFYPMISVCSHRSGVPRRLPDWFGYRSVFVGTLVLLIVAVQTLKAQQYESVTPLELVQWDRAKREVLGNHLQVSQAEAGAFWKAYESYESLRRNLLHDRLALRERQAIFIQDGAPESRINANTKRLLMNDLDQARVYKEFYKRISDIVGPRRAIRFIQIEKYFRLRLDARVDSLAAQPGKIFALKGGN
jgi:hypothetical protein